MEMIDAIKEALIEHSGGMKFLALCVYLMQKYADVKQEIPTDLDETVYQEIEKCPAIDILEYGATCRDETIRIKEFVYFKLREK
jgi:hypothetical protein